MKKIILVLVTLIVSIGASTTAYAGSINSNEQAVLSAAEQTYTYNGTQYRLDSSYVSQLRGYLAADDIDLTSEQRDKALAAVNGYIESGVQGGYLKPVGGGSDKQDSSSDSGNASSDNNQSSSSQTSDNSNTSDTGNSASGNSGTNSNTDNSASSGSVTDSPASDSGSIPANTTTGNQYNSNTGNINNNSNSGKQGSKNTSQESMDEFLLDLFAGTEDSNDTSDNVTKDDSSSMSNREEDMTIAAIENEDTEKSIIKNTGFDLSATFAIALLMGVVMLTGIVVTVKNHYFAQSDE